MTTAIVQSEARQSEVLTAIFNIKSSLVERSLELGELLVEAQDNEYHLDWGYPTWRAWFENSGLDMSERQGYYLMNVVRRSRSLGVPKDSLRKVKLSKLKVIMSLPSETDPEKIKGLVVDAETASLDTVKSVAAALTNTEHVYKTFKLSTDFVEGVYPIAVETLRRMAGSDVNDDGEVSDISESRCLELAYADIASSPIMREEIVDAEFEDSFQVE